MSRGNPVNRAYNQGRADAKRDMRLRVFNMLEKEYMDPAVERGSELGEAILELTRKVRAAIEEEVKSE